MNLQEKFIAHLRQFTFIQKNQKQLLAVSGGVDSIVLCHLMFVAQYDFVMAHCNFQLRGAESERDEQFVKLLGEKYQKKVLVKRFDTAKFAAEKKISIQVAARELRYEWFNDVVNEERTMSNEKVKSKNEKLSTYNLQLTTPYILTAHHANDNIETLLINFFKGTGIAGLHGILPAQGKRVRPLLFARKDEMTG